ncbi:MAG: restriction endonuclease subunit S [Sphingomonadales bacterium]|nr:MAG: restriction endonuclease subunit S [Sphingomonadales bacterium]
MTREVYLEDVASEVTVGHVGSMADEYLDDGIPFLRSLNIQPHRISREDIRYISPEFHGRLKKSALKPGDVVIVRTGKPGACAVIPEDLPVSNCSDLVIVRCGPEIRPRFLAYWVNAIASEHVASHLVGAVQQHFNVGAAKKMPIVLPDIAEQDKVLSILGALDDKIELNRRMSATLEEMARALYRSWFVDFDPVHARALGQSPAHMDDATAALFPDSFGPDGLPKGWEMSTIGEVAETVGGATPKTKEPTFWDGPHRWATPRDLSKLGQPILFETDRTITDEGLAKISSGLSPAGTVLLSSRAPIGYVAIAQNPVAVNQGFIALRETDRISSVEAYFWVQSNMDAIVANANGSTFQEISKKNFRPLPCVVAPDSVRGAFQNLAGTWFDRVAGLCAESANLAALRDTLLPRLMSGELRVREAEKQVEEVL